jgi:glutathione reductase (NADPH)
MNSWNFVLVGTQVCVAGLCSKEAVGICFKFHDFDISQGFGWSYDTEPVHDWKTLISNKNVELKRLTGVYKSLLQKSNVTLLEGHAKVQILTPLC